MKVIKWIVLSIVILAIVVALGGYIYLRSAGPKLNGTISLPGLKAEAEVLYDDFGIPHIYAQNDEDAYYALGYVHAQDRLFQMEMLRRAAGGRLAEVLGEELVKVDKLFRTLGLNHFAKQHAQKFMNADTATFQRLALAYQNGVNQFVKSGKTPIEFTLIGIPKEEFTPQDIYLAVGFMSFGFAEGFHADPVLQKIKTEWGEEYLKDLAVETPADAVLIKNFTGAAKSKGNDQLIAAINNALATLPVPLWQGSNGWVVSAEKSTTGFPILANDTHIGFAQPAVWYEAHLEYPGFSFYGHHLAGIPFGLLGNNRFCGFGLTMFENDDVDFFLETPNPENKNQVKYKESWEDLTSRTEIIKVKGKDDVLFEIKSSRHGPIINGIVENVQEEGDPVALAWQLLMMENHALQAAFKLNHATTFNQAREAVSMFSAPGLNVMYGDTDGNIAWWAAAKLPVRPAHVQSKLYLDGAKGNDEYLGYYDFTKNPQTINPPWGFVYSANNQPDTVDGVLYPGYYYPKSRAGRIFELLSADKKFSTEDLKTIQLDVLSRMHVEVAREIALVLKSSSLDENETIVLNELQNWDGNHKAGTITPSVYYNILSQIVYLAMEDELGTTALKSLQSTSIPKNSFHSFIGNDSSPWWDDVRTKDKKETRQEIVLRAAQKAIDLLQKNCGQIPNQWTWGKIHTLMHKHALNEAGLGFMFNAGPFVVDGGSEVLNNLHFNLDTTGYFHVTGGPALRKVTDFGNIENGETISPSGQSGNVMSPHYKDQAEMFATGKYRKMLMNRDEIVARHKNKLVLKPQ
ncbi:MAG: penicillin acylase family protein [Cyclobacteriaceae bacterium]|nr:penicillin acylase family protein [Cyclobacteriaceae bacterium]UYN86172.1 MAG: penicillin acylase family protein [Cyclobacteriaceae bacterium]